MITTKEFLESELTWGIGFHNPAFVALAEATANQLANLPVSTVLDFGAGTGVYTKAMLDKGYDVHTFELYPEHRQYISEHVPNVHFVDVPVSCDLLFCIEVLEHMTDQEIDQLFDTAKFQWIIFSSTSERVPVFDEDWGHINIKEQNEWIELFSMKGYEFVEDLKLPCLWAKLFKKKVIE